MVYLLGMGADEMNDLKMLRADVARILSYLESDHKVKKEGLVEQVNRIDDQVEKLERKVDQYFFKIMMVAGAAGTIIQVFWLVLGKFFKTTL
jgi:hypothetical protein